MIIMFCNDKKKKTMVIVGYPLMPEVKKSCKLMLTFSFITMHPFFLFICSLIDIKQSEFDFYTIFSPSFLFHCVSLV